MSGTTTPLDPTQHPAGSLVNGKVAKLRASCDACNESKVRCSQKKPRCARCEKQGIRCIYGLSRRSHKTAPRIGASSTSHSAAAAAAEVEVAAEAATAVAMATTAATARVAASSAGSAKPKRQRRRQDEKTGVAATPEVDHHDFFGSLGLDFDMCMQSGVGGGLDLDLSPGTRLGSSFDPMDGLLNPMSSYDYLDHRFFPMPRANIVPDNNEGFFMEDFRPHSPPSTMQHQGSRCFDVTTAANVPSMAFKTCECSGRIARKLNSIPASFPHDGVAPFDVQLSQLKQATKLSEDVLRCDCASWDEMTIRLRGNSGQGDFSSFSGGDTSPSAVSSMGDLLGGFTTSPSSSAASLSGTTTTSRSSPNTSIGSMSNYGSLFPETLAPVTSSPSPPILSASFNNNAPGASGAASAVPRLSWGVLQVEYDDDVDDLKQHLWIVHFRKLEALIRRFGSAVRQMRNGYAGAVAGCSAQVMACEGVCKWLDQKARTVREKFEAQEVAATWDGGRKRPVF